MISDTRLSSNDKLCDSLAARNRVICKNIIWNINMIKGALLWIFILAALVFPSAQAQDLNGAWLLRGIEATERIVQNTPQPNDNKVAMELRFYVRGLLAMNRYADTLAGPYVAILNSGTDKAHNERMKRFIPLHVPLKWMTRLTYGQALTVIKKHLLAKPAEMKTDAVLVVIEAFEQ